MIDDLKTLSTRRAFLYRGKSDTTYKKGSVNVTADFFRLLMEPGAVYFEEAIDSPHLVPGIDPYLCWWEEWGGPDKYVTRLILFLDIFLSLSSLPVNG